MSRRRRVLRLSLLGAMLQLTASLAVASQVVVCRAPSGHVAIESVLDGDCCPPGVAEPTRRELRAADACDGCIDTPLLRVGLSAPSKDLGGVLAPAPRYVAPVWVACGAGAPVARRSGDGSRPCRTVVLVI